MKKDNEVEMSDSIQKKFNKVSVASLVFCIIGIFVAGLPCGLIAMVTGIIGTATIKSEKEKGRWMAITGLVVGVIEIIAMALYIVAQASGLIA